jgi:peptidyl-prolyl cis-trans isomerase SurA
MMKFGTFRGASGVVALTFLAAAAAAQTGASQPAPSGSPLNIPSNVNFVGTPQNANVARATAIVNDEIITRSDIDHRIALFVASQRIQLPAEEMERARAQILRNLIDETLQIQAAREKKIEIEQKEIDDFYKRFAGQFGHTPKSFADYLKSIGSSERTVKRQILGELSWRQLQRRLPQVSVADDEVKQILDRLNASRGAPEYRVAEIYLAATPENAEQVRGRVAQIVQQIRAGASFPAFARQYSEATTAAVGGDLGWVRAEQLPAELAAVVQSMPVGTISDPIQVPGGFSVLVLADSRQVLVANPRDAVLSLMQMTIDMPAGTTEAVARQRAEQLARATQSMGGCGGAANAAQSVGAELVSNDAVRVRELPPQLQQMLLGMNIGQVTQPFGTAQRISVLVLCGRDDPKAAPTPTFASIANALEEDRMSRQAQRFLRDLRRDAVVEYR